MTSPPTPPLAGEPATERTKPAKTGRSDECQEVRALMPEHLFHTLSCDLDEKVIAHVRLCAECHSVLMALRLGIEVAAEETQERKNAR